MKSRNDYTSSLVLAKHTLPRVTSWMDRRPEMSRVDALIAPLNDAIKSVGEQSQTVQREMIRLQSLSAASVLSDTKRYAVTVGLELCTQHKAAAAKALNDLHEKMIAELKQAAQSAENLAAKIEVHALIFDLRAQRFSNGVQALGGRLAFKRGATGWSGIKVTQPNEALGVNLFEIACDLFDCLQQTIGAHEPRDTENQAIPPSIYEEACLRRFKETIAQLEMASSLLEEAVPLLTA